MDVKLNIILGQLFSSEDARLQKCSSYQVSVFEYFLNSPFLVLFFFFILFIWVLSFGCTGPSLLRVSFLQLWRAWAALQLWCMGFSLQRLLLLQSVGCTAWAQQLSRTGLVARGHVESSQTRDQTHIPCTGRCILNHRTTREVLDLSFKLDPAPWPWLNVSWRCHRFFDSTGATGKTPSSLSQPKVHKKKIIIHLHSLYSYTSYPHLIHQNQTFTPDCPLKRALHNEFPVTTNLPSII